MISITQATPTKKELMMQTKEPHGNKGMQEKFDSA
jgi:hypothetical protein